MISGDENRMRMVLGKYNKISTGVQHLFLLISVVFIAGMTYSVMSADIITLQKSRTEMKKIVTGINKEINSIKIEQAVAAERFLNLEEKQKEFRERTDVGLGKILDRLNK